MLPICIFVAFALVFGATGTAFQPDSGRPRVDSEFLLRQGKAGPVELGPTVDQLYAHFGRDNIGLVDLFLEGMFSPAVQIHILGSETQPAIIAPIREWPCADFSVWGITVRDRRFRISDGFGVGSTLGDLRKTFRRHPSMVPGPLVKRFGSSESSSSVLARPSLSALCGPLLQPRAASGRADFRRSGIRDR